jgi:hypothetical protein
MPRRRREASIADLAHIDPSSPHLSRITDIRAWMIAQAGADDSPVAGLALTISASGQIEAAVRGIEPEHADLVIEHLDRLRASLEAWAASERPPQLPLCTVLRIRS